MGHDQPCLRALPEAVEAGTVTVEAIDACVRRIWRPSCGSACSISRTSTKTRPRVVLADPAHREVARVAAERSAVSAQRGRPAPLDPSSLTSWRYWGRWRTPSATRSPWVFDFDLGRDGHGARGLRSRLGLDRGSVRAGIRPAQRVFPSMFDTFPGKHSRPTPRLRRRGRAAEAVDMAATATWPWWCSASGSR
jgi:beta-glucosidase